MSKIILRDKMSHVCHDKKIYHIYHDIKYIIQLYLKNVEESEIDLYF